MLITTPSGIQNPMFDGTLETIGIETEDDGATFEMQDYPERGSEEPLFRSLTKAQEISRWGMPSITIGDPQVWNVSDVYRKRLDSLPEEIQLLLNDNDFFLVRLACSFRFGPDTIVQWARFSVDLQPERERVIAFALHPLRVEDKVRNDVDIKLSPSLEFEEIKVEVGELAFHLHYTEVFPIIEAEGLQESRFGWQLSGSSQYPLIGARWFHAIIKKAHGAGSVDAAFDVVADVLTPNGIFRAKPQIAQGAHLLFRILP